MVSINGKLHSWSSIAKVAECGAGALIVVDEVDITDRRREPIGGLCVKCWPTLPNEEDE